MKRKRRRTLMGMILLTIFIVLLTACNGQGNLPKPPVGGALPQATLPAMPSGPGALPTAMPSLPALGSTTAPTAVPTATADWSSVEAQAEAIQRRAQQMQPALAQVAEAAKQIRQNETDPDVTALASQIADLAAQAQQEASQLAITANDINYRIDHSEATTLRLSDDIGKMADRIGKMADRILWTEGQIGVMADRIVHSEHLINDGTQQTIDQIQETIKQIDAWTRDIAAQAAAIKNQTQQPGQTEQGGTMPTAANDHEAAENTPQPTANTAAQSGGSSLPGGAGASAAAPGGQTPPTSPRQLEVLSRSIALNAQALQQNLDQAKADALALDQNALADALSQAQKALAQLALTASDLAAHAKAADALTPQLTAYGQQAQAQMAGHLQALTTALQSAQRALPTDPAQADLRRAIETAQVTAAYMRAWNTEIARLLGR